MSDRKGTLLVVDDNDMNRDLLSRRLERERFLVLKAESGRQALELLQTVTVDLVLLDVDMPDLDGFDVLEALRGKHTAAHLPVVMVTAMSASEDIVKALRLGANDYVTKPIDFPVAIARITTQLERKRAEEALRESEERYALAARGSNDGLWDYDLRKKQIYYSSRWKSMLGWEEEEICAEPDEWFERVHAEDAERLKAEIQAHVEGQTLLFEAEYRMRHRDGGYRWMLGRGIAVRDAEGRAYRMAGSQTDITRGKVADALTGLPNRILFIDQLGRCLERSKRYPDFSFAVIFLDLDGFKLINDSFGHVTGDLLLVTIARRLEQSLRSVDLVARLEAGCTLARLGGDEFTILVDGIRTVRDATAVAERIQQELSVPFSVGGQEIFTSASMGIAINCPGYDRAEDLVRDADTAMYRAKMRGKSCYEVFDSEMRETTIARLRLETELRHAVERAELVLHYQPIVRLETGRIAAFEALLRWRHPARGLLLPAEFIAVAEETGLIIEMEDWALHEATRQIRAWQARYPATPPIGIAVNLSSKHFMMPDLLHQCERTLRETGLDPSHLTLEITESTVVTHPGVAATIMAGLRSLNIRISMDDFGTGYSSLSYLQRFPFDNLKIDRSFVCRMHTSADSTEIVKTIVALAHNLKLEVVAEGVETTAQFQSLRDLGCEMAQGSIFDMPLRADQAEELLVQEPHWHARIGGVLVSRT